LTTGFPVAPPTGLPLSAASSSNPRKGLNTIDDSSSTDINTKPEKTRQPTPTQTIIIPQSVQAPPTNLPDMNGGPIKNHDKGNNNGGNGKKNDDLDPTAERLLIAAGAIGM
jgi:hypothetical protein